MKVETKYDLGELVALRHDKQKEERMVVQITIAGTGVRYNLMCGTSDIWHYEQEIARSHERKRVTGFKP